MLPPAPAPTTLGQKIRHWQDRVREPALTGLLLGQVGAIFAVGPLVGAGLLPFWAIDAAQVLLLGISYFALPRGSWVRWLVPLCALPMLWVACRGANRVIGLSLHMVATVAITGMVALAVLRAERITRHQLLGAVVVYLNLALLFMGAYDVVSAALPGAFTTAAGLPARPGDMLYFSLTTLTSTGYGDLLPVHPLARSLANLEAVLGQLFIAILLARLVSQHGRGGG